VIRPSRGWVPLRLGELWAYRELLGFLVWRDVKVRYKQTVLGALWAIIQPFFMMIVFTVFFQRLGKIPTDGVPGPIFYYSALLPWTYFATALGSSSNSLVASRNLITKVYFPRLVIPTAPVVAGLVDFAIAFLVLVGMMLHYRFYPTIATLFMPLFLLMAAATALGVSLWLSAMNAKYRDIRYAVPFLTQFWMFASPVVYPLSLVPEGWRTVYSLNPMVSVIEGFRWTVVGSTPPEWRVIAASAGAVAVLVVTGAYYFRRTEKTFADVV
jgi:lipopolysaccharide transport system permease protein